MTEILEKVKVFFHDDDDEDADDDRVVTIPRHFLRKQLSLKHSTLSFATVMNGALKSKIYFETFLSRRKAKRKPQRCFFLCKICRTNMYMNPYSLYSKNSKYIFVKLKILQ